VLSSTTAIIGHPSQAEPCNTGKLSLLQGANKCYMDSVLQLLMVNSPENILGQYIFRYLENIKDQGSTHPNIKQLSKSYVDLYQQIDQGKSPNLRVFIQKLNNFPDSKRFCLPNAEDPIDFLSFLLTILGIPNKSYNMEEEYYCKDKLIEGIINEYSNLVDNLTDITTKYSCDVPIIKINNEPTDITIMNPSIRINDINVQNNTIISNLLAWSYSWTKIPWWYLAVTTAPGYRCCRTPVQRAC